jgi:hypothetical protein
MLAAHATIAYVYRAFTGRDRLPREGFDMQQLRSTRQLIKMWRRRAKTISRVGHTADAASNSTPGTVHSAFTQTGLAVADQVRKAWQTGPLGLARF